MTSALSNRRLFLIGSFALLLIAAGIWLGTLFRAPPKAPPPSPGPTLLEASANSLETARTLRRQVTAPPSPPASAAPAIHLRAGPVPLAPPSDAPLEHPRPSARGYPWMILFDSPICPEWKTAIEQAGGTIRGYLPQNALLVEAPEPDLARLRRLPQVAWTGEYRPIHKIQPLLAAWIRQEPEQTIPVTLQTFSPDDLELLTRALAQAGASDIRSSAGKRWGIARAALPAQNALELARLPEVQWLEYYQPPQLLNDIARSAERLNVEPLHQSHNLDGTGQIVAIADTGLDTGNTNTLHPDLAGRLLHVFDIGRGNDWSDRIYHGTHVAGSIIGTGAASTNQYRGVAPGAKLIVQSAADADDYLIFPEDLNELYAPPYDMGARVHSGSWGGGYHGDYDTDAITSDEFIWDHPDMLIVYAAGNDGEDYDDDGVVDLMGINSPGTAKNVLTVGASEIGRPSGSGGMTGKTWGQTWYWLADCRSPPISGDLISSSPNGHPQGMAAFSSRGPTLDGRVKPDVVAPGTDVISIRSRGSWDLGWGVVSNNTNYCFMGGTSMATPLAAGTAALVRQFCIEHRHIASPSAALIKAILTGGARSLSPGQYGSGQHREIPEGPRPNVVEGWGQVDAGGSLFPANGQHILLLEGPALSSDETHALNFLVTNASPLNVTMAYSDYPASPAASWALVNDLDLLLIAPDQTRHHPNGLDGPDNLNNLEGLDLPVAATGLWSAVVIASNVPSGPQPFALYVRGAVLAPADIEHTPLPNTFATNQDYQVIARVTSAGEFNPDSVLLHWRLSGLTNAYTTVPMSTTNGMDYQADIPAQPVGSRINYYLTAGPEELITYAPATAPDVPYSFEVTPTFTLTISGTPDNLFTVEPAYGAHGLASNLLVEASAPTPPDNDDTRVVCVGWTGTGSAPPTGTSNSCSFHITEDSTLTWHWQEQLALLHSSSPPGALIGLTWHPLNGSAASLPTPESHSFDGIPYSFSGWTVDGQRWPPPPAPSPLQIENLSMPTSRVAVALYTPVDEDQDANGLPDWFELRHFGQLGQDPYADSDSDGYENILEAADHTDPFDSNSIPTPPVITHDPLPAVASSPAPWLVAATITDNDQVAAATLHWTRNGGIARTLAMIPDPEPPDQFVAQLPAPARDGDTIVYHLSAADRAGLVSSAGSWTVGVSYARMDWTPAHISTAAPNSTVSVPVAFSNPGSQPLELSFEIGPVGFHDDMESGTNGWTRPDNNTDWHLSTANSHSPSHAWYCGSEHSGYYRNLTHASLVSPLVQLANDNPRLHFMHRARFELDVDEIRDGKHYWDAGVMEITANAGLTWQPLPPVGGYPGNITSNPASPFPPETPCFVNTDDWDPVEADLTPYAGKEIQLRFRFGADMYVYAEGWRIDDLEITPRTLETNWLQLGANHLLLEPAEIAELLLYLDSTLLPPMATGHLALRVHHNDPEHPSPLTLPIAFQNSSRQVQVTAIGSGQANPDGTFLLNPGDPLELELTAVPGHFIAEVLINRTPAPLPELVSTQTLSWVSLDDNLEIQVTFAPILDIVPIPAEWLAQHGLTASHWMAEASLDPDRDGLLTWQEYELGSNPTNPADAPLILRLHHPEAPAGAWHVSWHAYTNLNRSYNLLASSNLQTGFVTLTNLNPAPPVMTSPPLPPNHRFFGLQFLSPNP